MSAPEAAEKMMSLPGYGNILIRSWVKCSVQVIQAKAQLVELTRLCSQSTCNKLNFPIDL